MYAYVQKEYTLGFRELLNWNFKPMHYDTLTKKLQIKNKHLLP